VFTSEVVDQVKWYVYRLIDPRNGETFYVGKGNGNRVFAHAKDELGRAADDLTEKLSRIRQIRIAGLDVQHVIHRHGLDEETAFEVEAALIDAYPEAMNLIAGRGSDDRGVVHSSQIIERYMAKQADFEHSAILINVNHSATEKGVYEAVRFAWRIDPNRASNAELVLAVDRGLIIGVFRAKKWLAATTENFPGVPIDPVMDKDRWGFDGEPAPKDIATRYLRRRVPSSLRRKGAANPITYVSPGKGLSD